MKHRDTEATHLHVRTAIKASMAQTAFAHLDGIDGRTALLLQCSGIMRMSSPMKGPEIDPALLVDKEHPLRVQSVPGPLLLHSQKGEHNHLCISDVADLLFSPSVEGRTAALAFFAELTSASPPVLDESAKALVRSSEAGLKSTDDILWRRTAIRLFDALKDDFRLNLAGTAQALQYGLNDQIAEFLTPVLRPGPSIVQQIGLTLTDPCQQQLEIASIIRDCTEANGTLADACDMYFDSVGFVPLAGHLSMGRMVAHWCQNNGTPSDISQQLWQWCRSRKSPVAEYHVLMAMLSHQEWITADGTEAVRTKITEIASLGHKEAQQPERWAQWSLRRNLARHYLYYMECQLPRLAGETIPLLAWWLSEKVARALAPTWQHSVALDRETVQKELEHSSEMWLLAGPAHNTTPIRYATQYVSWPWQLAVLCQLGGSLEALGVADWSDELKRQLQSSLLRNVVIGYPPYQPQRQDVPALAFEQGLFETADRWCAAASIPEQEELLKFGIGIQVHMADDDKFAADLRELMDKQDTVRTCLAQALKTRVHCGKARFLVESVLADRDWWNRVLGELDEALFGLLIEAVIAEQSARGGVLCGEVSHRLADWLMGNDGQPERTKALFSTLVVMCLHSGDPSALDRILRRDKKFAHGSFVEEWRIRLLAQASGFSLPWVKARIRPILARLRV